MKFWGEWKDKIDGISIEAILNWSVGLIALLIFAFNLNNSQIALPALFIMILSILRGVLALMEYVKENHPVLSIVSYGDTKKFVIFGLLGLAIPLITFSGVTYSIAPHIPFTSIPLLTQSQLNFIFVVFLSPFAEEFFFRGLLFFTFALLLKNIGFKKFNYEVSMLGTSALFALFHFVAYNADINSMISAFVFSIIWIIGNQFFKTLAFSTGFHVAWNYVSLMR